MQFGGLVACAVGHIKAKLSHRVGCSYKCILYLAAAISRVISAEASLASSKLTNSMI